MKLSIETAHVIAEMIEGHRNCSPCYDPLIESELVEVSNLLYKLPEEYKVILKVKKHERT
jgi:hypothetical protein